ncbi:MAG: DUF115 domain-containing protein [Candidatus Thermoplasmatota archaeon]|nr:DUF115 domain-containing protein [Candidatus Thermoplasmatota archaeon]
MEIDRWIPYYEAICSDLKLDVNRDMEASRLLADMLKDNRKVIPRDSVMDEVGPLVSGRSAYIFGAGPDLEEELEQALIEKADEWASPSKNDVLIAADGATSALMARSIRPDLIVSDLDGDLEDQLACLGSGSIMFVHAHGDNMLRIREAVPRLFGKVVGTTQLDPMRGAFLYNFGGFSDGDRSAFIAEHFGASQIILLGFNFNEVGDKISGGGSRSPLTPDQERLKFRKMTWAFALLGLITRPQVRSFSQNLPLFAGP